MLKFYTFISFLCLQALFTAPMAYAEDVIIFHNSDPQLAIASYDKSYIDGNTAELVQLVKKMEPGLHVRVEPVANLIQAQDILRNTTETVRAVIFVGHGNERVYALNNMKNHSAYDMASTLARLNPKKMSSRLTVYFLACSLADKTRSQKPFQEQFYEEYIRLLPSTHRERVDVIAHIAMTSRGSARDATILDRFSYKSGIGRYFERFSLVRFPAVPNLAFLGLAVGLAATQNDGITAMTMTLGALGTIYIREVFEKGLGKFATLLSKDYKTTDSAYKLLEMSLKSNKCHSIYSL